MIEREAVGNLAAVKSQSLKTATVFKNRAGDRSEVDLRPVRQCSERKNEQDQAFHNPLHP